MPQPKPLLLIAGLPKKTAEPAANTINNGASGWRALATEFGADHRIYRSADATEELMRLACRFALELGKDEEPIPNPSWLVLAYVQAPQCDTVLDAFGNSVLPRVLDHPAWTWEGGQHWRHHIETVNALLAAEVATLNAPGESRDLHQRLVAHRSDDPLLLPAKNFRLDGDAVLGDRFSQWRRRQIDLAVVEADIQVKRFRFERLARFYAKCGGRNKDFAIDHRGLVFARAGGQHGGAYSAAVQDLASIESMRLLLEGRFRFGCPLRPAGFQNDVQRDWDQALHLQSFYCAGRDKGVEVSGTHANIFGNDVVTEG